MQQPLLVLALPFAAACALVSCAAAATVPAPAPTTPPAQVLAIVRAPVDNSVYPGISVAVGNTSAGVITALAYGSANLASGTRLTTTTPMRMASISKSITAAAILMLDQAGAISIDKPVITYVPQFTSNGANITLRQLLNQSSGIPGHDAGDPILHGDGPITQEQFFEKLNTWFETKPYPTPGTHWDYSNANYYLLADVVQNVTGQTLAAWLQQNIFTPAGMTSTYADMGQAMPAPALPPPLGYTHWSSSNPFIQCPAPDWSGELGAGGIISTPSDIVRFDIALFNGTLMDATHRQEMLAPSFPVANGVSYAFGWFTLPNVLTWHDGDFTTVAATNVVFPDGTFVVEAANGADISPDFDRMYLARQLQNLYGVNPVALGSPHPPDLRGTIGPFTTCAQLDTELFGS
jgi:CubicO group peptidase (beta-lactamase class C family)